MGREQSHGDYLQTKEILPECVEYSCTLLSPQKKTQEMIE